MGIVLWVRLAPRSILVAPVVTVATHITVVPVKMRKEHVIGMGKALERVHTSIGLILVTANAREALETLGIALLAI